MPKKRKYRRRASSSSEENEVSPERDYKSGRKKAKIAVKSQGNLESSADEREKSTSSARKDDSQSPRQVRKRLSTLTQTKTSKRSPVNEEIRYTESRSVCSSKTKNHISKKEKTIKGSKTEERYHSKPIYTKHGVTVPSSKKISESISKESSRHSPSTSLKQPGTSSSVLAKQEKWERHAKKKKSKAEVPSWTGNHCRAARTKGSPSTSSKDAAQQNREELIKKDCRRHQTKVFEDKKSICTDKKHPSYCSTKMSSIVATSTASENSLKGLKKHTSVSGIVKSDLKKRSESSSIQKKLHPFTPFHFKIPKKIQIKTIQTLDKNKYGVSTTTHLKNEIKLPDPKVVAVDSNQETAVPVQSCLSVPPHHSFEEPSASSSLQSPVDINTNTSYDQIHVVEQLHLARSQRRLEVNVMESYGELTSMDIDPPEEGSAYTQYEQPQQAPILVLDTNILLSHLDYVKKISSEGLNALGFPHILIPWVVLQELDSLKKGRGLSGSVAHLAIPAISYIYNSLRNRKPRIWGQSMQQAAERRPGLNAENNDDRVLQCCLQYQSLYPECALILCTDDKNLCSKALLSGVRALSHDDLKAEAERSQHGVHIQEHIQGLMPPQVSLPMQRRSCSHVQPNVRETGGFSAGFLEKDKAQLCKVDEDRTTLDLSRCISEFEDCLREVLSDVLEVEMKTVYEDLWTEIVFLKPPWTLQDVLKCFGKHWVAVFRYILPMSSHKTIVNLTNFFNSGYNKDHVTTSKVLEEARKLVQMFQKRSSNVPRALSVMDKIYTKLHPQESHELLEGESSTFDVVMSDDDGTGSRDDEAKEGKQSLTHQVSHQEVWAMFESIWTVVSQTSMEVFKALGFDTHTRQSAQPARDSAPPQDALVCLHKLSTVVSQLLRGFSSVLSSTPDIEEVQTLLSIIQSHKIAGGESNVTAKHLLDCFLQPEYSEKLQFGGRQLVDLQDALNCCVQANVLNFTS